MEKQGPIAHRAARESNASIGHWRSRPWLFWALAVFGLGFLAWTVYDRLWDIPALKEEIRSRDATIAARDRRINLLRTQLAPIRAMALDRFPGAKEGEAIERLAMEFQDLQQQIENPPSVIQKIVVVSQDRRLALEMINPRTPAAPADSYVTTLYLIRNFSDRPLVISGGPRFEWRTPRESGTDMPLGMHVKDKILLPGRSWTFTAESWVGKSGIYPRSFSLYDGTGVSFESLERSRGLEHRVVFNFSSTCDGKTTEVSLAAPWINLVK